MSSLLNLYNVIDNISITVYNLVNINGEWDSQKRRIGLWT